jgi:hypothetical protein
VTRPTLAALAAGVALLVLATTGAHLYSIDGLEYYRVADGLVHAGRLDFDPPLNWGTPISMSYAPIGFSLALIPAVLLAQPLHHLQPPFPATPYDYVLLYGDPMVAGIAWVNPLIVGLTSAVTGILATRLGGSPRTALAAGFLAVVAGPLFFYGRSDVPQALTALLLTSTLVLAIDARRGSSRSGPILAVLIAATLLSRPVDGVLGALAAGLILAWPARSRVPGGLWPGAGWIIAGISIGLSGDALVNFLRWGNPLEFGYGSGFRGSMGPILAAELISPGKGLLLYFPLSLLAIPGAVTTFRRGLQAETVGVLAAVAAMIGVYSLWQGLGGWAWGPRYLVPLVPMLAALGALAGRGRVWKVAFAIAAAAGILVNTGHLAVDQLRIVWPIYGDNVYGTPGFDRQFELGAFGPIASWSGYHGGSDIALLQAADSTGGWSVVALVAMLIAALALIASGVRRAGSSSPEVTGVSIAT